MRSIVEEAVLAARAALAEGGADRDPPGPSLADYHATMVGVIAGPAGGHFFHIGDGAAAAIEALHEGVHVISPPENGEYANETFFFTEPNWQAHLRIVRFPRSEILILATDGAASLAFTERYMNVKPAVIVPLTAYLEGADVERGKGGLERLFDREDARRESDDDKTLIWARWMPG